MSELLVERWNVVIPSGLVTAKANLYLQNGAKTKYSSLDFKKTTKNPKKPQKK